MRRTAVLVVVMAGALSGCFSVDGTLEADGSARFRLTYFLGSHATFRDETRRFTSEHVQLESLRGIGNREATAEIHVDDVTRLSSAEAFHTVAVTRTRDGGVEAIHLVIANPYDAAHREALLNQARDNPAFEGPRIALTLPGRVLEASSNAQIDGSRVTWRVPLSQYATTDRLELSVRYAPPGG